MNKEIRYPSKQTIDKLTKDLNLEGADEFTQDWEYEVANSVQLQSYIEYYQNKNLNLNEKATLMRIILEAFNDFVTLNYQKYEYWKIIKELLKQDYFIHKETIEYWSCGDEDLENGFMITALIRSIKESE